MKKKILLSLLSIFLTITVFTSNVFADAFNTSGEIFSTASDCYDWTNDNGVTFLGIVNIGIDSQSVTTNDNLTYTFTWSGMTLSLVTDGSVLKSIIVAECTSPNYNGTYTKKVKISDIMPDDFPTDETSQWTNGTYQLFKSGSNLNIIGKALNIPLSSILSDDGNGNYMMNYTFVVTGKITFVMGSSKFTSVIIEFPSPADEFNGTYSIQSPQTKISDILPNDFPTSSTTGYINEKGKRLYKSTSNNLLKVGDADLDINAAVTQSGNNYTYTSPVGANYVFNMNNGNISSIVSTGYTSDSDSDGTYTPYRLLDTVGPFSVGYEGDIVFRTNGRHTDNYAVSIGGTELAKNTDYTLTQGSAKFTILGDYVKDNLSSTVSTHTVKITSAKYPDIEFTISFTDTPPGGGGGSGSGSGSSGHAIPNTGVK